MHRIVKRNCFALTIGVGAELDLFGSFPFRGEAVRNRPQVSDPMIDQRD